MEDNIPEGLAVFDLPGPMRNRTRVAGLFPNETSRLRLVSAVLSEIGAEWETGKIYLNTEGMPA